MKAILLTHTGEPDVLSLQAIPEPEISQNTQIKVKLHAAGINPIDTKIRRQGLLGKQPLPAVLGCDGAGEIVAIGKDITRFNIGDKVWFCHGGLGDEQGNYAEYTVLDQRWASLMPTRSSFTEAAALPLVLITAWGALYNRGNLQTGQTVLIHAGAGGVGHVAIQLAKIKGARIITTVNSEAKAQWVKTLGADETIIYTETNVVDAVNDLTDGKGADLVFDTVGSEVFKTSIEATAYFGRLITLLDPGEQNWSTARLKNLLIGFELMLTPMLKDLPEARDQHVKILQECANYIDLNLLKPHINQTIPLEQATLAHQLIEEGHTVGKIVLTIN